MPNALSIFDSESQLGPVDFEMGLDVEEQARISEHRRLSFGTTPERNGLQFEIYEDPEESGEVGGTYHPAPPAETGGSMNQAYQPHHTLMDAQFTFPPLPDDGNYHSEPERQTQGRTYANSPKYQSDDYYCGDEDQTEDEDEGKGEGEAQVQDQENMNLNMNMNMQMQMQNPSGPPSSTSTIRQTQIQAQGEVEAEVQAGSQYNSSFRTHRRVDSEESYTTHWGSNGTCPNSSLPTFRTRLHYKSPYLGPVGWTVPSRYTSITRLRVEAERNETRTRTEAEREREMTPLTRLRVAALSGMDTEEVDDGYAGDVESRSEHEHEHEHGHGHGSGNGSLRASGRSRVVCQRCESKPFLIYQDPAWIDVRGVDVDPFVNAAASDDKENVDPNGRGDVDGDGDVAIDDDEEDEDGDVEMGG